MAKISIIMGSQSDLETVQEAINVLKEFKAGFEAKVLSAHRTPKELAAYVEAAAKRGTKVFICAAGGAAAGEGGGAAGGHGAGRGPALREPEPSKHRRGHGVLSARFLHDEVQSEVP